MNYFKWLNDASRKSLHEGPLKSLNVTAEERVEQIVANAAKISGSDELGENLKEVIARGWCSLSSPIWANYGLDRGLPISCYGSYIGDSVDSIADTVAEVAIMCKEGGGTSGYLGDIRGRGERIQLNGESHGTLPFMSWLENTATTISQGSTRRGKFAGYIDATHKDIFEWLDIQKEGNIIQSAPYGVCLSDEFMRGAKEGTKNYRKILAKILESRSETGLPYIMYTDNANNNAPEVYRDKHRIHASNLCTEIMLPTNDAWSFVCCLSSMNLAKFDEWKGTHAVNTMVRFLDTVMTEFIEKASKIKKMEKAVNFAVANRALGLGALGWHDLLQSKSIAFDSMEAMMLNAQTFGYISKEAHAASRQLAMEFGQEGIMIGTDRRNATVMAVAPTKSSSFILEQTSQGVEPHVSNYFVNNLANAEETYKNRRLEKVLDQLGKNTSDVWLSILKHDGSVAHLDFLDDHTKEVFKTFQEISQLAIIQQAAQRQKFIDQGQSINLTIHPDTHIKDMNTLLYTAWELGVKSLYYQYSTSAAQNLNRDLLNCSSCEG